MIFVNSYPINKIQKYIKVAVKIKVTVFFYSNLLLIAAVDYMVTKGVCDSFMT